jgi:hypothetical protein
MIGCLMLLPITGAFVAMGVYMSALMACLASVAVAMGIYMGGIIAYLTAFFMFVFG